MQRTVNAPDQDLLSARQVADWLNVGVTQLREMVRAGDFPPGVTIGKKKATRWYWMDVVSWSYLKVRMGQAGTSEGNGRRPAGK